MDTLEKLLCEKPFTVKKPDGTPKTRDPNNVLGRAMELVDSGMLVVEEFEKEYRFTPNG